MITEALQEKLKFAFHTKPYDHQKRVFEESRDRPYFGLLWEMGTGKSKVIVDTAAWQFIRGEIDGVLILSDKGQYLSWHYEEFEKHLMPAVPRRMAFWSSGMKSADAQKLEKVMAAKDDFLDVMCINIESLGSERAFNEARRFIQSHYVLMAVDESTSIKNPKAKRAIKAWELGLNVNFRRIMTGTPITQGPLDLFAQCHFLQPGCIGHTSFTAFRAEYANLVLNKFAGRRGFYQIRGYRNLDQLKQVIRPFTSRILKTECLDLPEKIYETLYVEMAPEQHRAYDHLKSMALVQFAQGLLTSTSALTTINKLQQIVCGHVKIDEGATIDIPSERVNVTLDLMEQLGEKVVIWCAFQRDVQLLLEGIRLRFPHPKFAVHYYGETSDLERRDALENFEKEQNCIAFVGTGKTGGKGINRLVGCRYVIYYSNTYHLEIRLQSEDRNHRIGQTRDVTYFDIVSPGTVDTKILKALKSKHDLARTVLDDFEELLTP